jgi:hypothetical protein
MALKEKFKQWFIKADKFSMGKTVLADRCEEIADEFAIGFKDWCAINEQCINYSQNHTTKELLEIYKKEKVL